MALIKNWLTKHLKIEEPDLTNQCQPADSRLQFSASPLQEVTTNQFPAPCTLSNFKKFFSSERNEKFGLWVCILLPQKPTSMKAPPLPVNIYTPAPQVITFLTRLAVS